MNKYKTFKDLNPTIIYESKIPYEDIEDLFNDYLLNKKLYNLPVYDIENDMYNNFFLYLDIDDENDANVLKEYIDKKTNNCSAVICDNVLSINHKGTFLLLNDILKEIDANINLKSAKLYDDYLDLHFETINK